MSSMEATFTGMFGGPCPGCGEYGELLAQDVTYGGYRQLRHMDGSGHEHLCTVPEEQGVLYTSADGWRYEAKGVTEARQAVVAAAIAYRQLLGTAPADRALDMILEAEGALCHAVDVLEGLAS